MDNLYNLGLIIILAPLLGAIVAGLFGSSIGRKGAHSVTILGVAIALVLSAVVFKLVVIDEIGSLNATVFTWQVAEVVRVAVGFFIDAVERMVRGVLHLFTPRVYR